MPFYSPEYYQYVWGDLAEGFRQWKGIIWLWTIATRYTSLALNVLGSFLSGRCWVVKVFSSCLFPGMSLSPSLKWTMSLDIQVGTGSGWCPESSQIWWTQLNKVPFGTHKRTGDVTGIWGCKYDQLSSKNLFVPKLHRNPSLLSTALYKIPLSFALLGEYLIMIPEILRSHSSTCNLITCIIFM